MTTALTKPIAGNTLSDLVRQPKYNDRFREIMRDRAPQFVTSILQCGASLGKHVEPNSIINTCMRAAAVDLPIDKTLGYCWAVPYKSGDQWLAQFQMGYKGYIQLALRTGQYSRLTALAIYEGELENYDRFTGDIKFNAETRTSDKIIGYACYMRLVTGFEHAEFWATKDIQDHAKRYSQAYRAGKETPWKTHFDEMAMKTVISSMLRKWGPMSIQINHALKADQSVTLDLDAEPQYFDNPQEVAAPKKKPALGKAAAAPPADEPGNPDDAPPEQEPGPAEQPAPTEPEPQLSVQAQLTKALEVVPFAAFSTWAVKLGHITADEHAHATAYMDLSTESCTKLLASPKQIKNCITLNRA